MTLAETEDAILRVCLARTAPAADLARLGDPGRWELYRHMVRQRLGHLLRTALPRTAALVPDTLEATIEEWLAVVGPRSRHLWQVVGELVDFATPRWQLDPGLAPWAPDLLLYEHARWLAANVEAGAVGKDAFAFERAAVLNPTLQVIAVEHAVHRRADDGHGFRREAHTLCLYRKDGAVEVSCLATTPLGGELLRAWRAGAAPTTEAVRAVARRRGEAVEQAFVTAVAGTIADLLEAGVVLGSTPA